MFCFKSDINYFTLLHVLCIVLCLEEVAALKDNAIAMAEAAIRATFNNLFVTFQIRDVAHNPRLKEFSITHNFFVSMTLNDGENIEKITQLSRVYNIANNTQYFMRQINDIFNEGDKSYEVTDDKYVDSHIVKFIKKLSDFQKTYTFNRNFANFSINSDILKQLSTSELTNVTNNYNDEIWKPTSRSGRRIYQGHRTRIKHYPFIVSVHFFKRFQCAGSIIEKDLVITAASCLQLAWNNRFFRENPAFLSVQVGSNFYEASGEKIPIYEIYFHPEYIPKTLVNNLAIMRLKSHIKFTKRKKNVKKIEFDRNPSALSINTNGIIIVGWGAKDQTNAVYDPWANKLSFAELDYYLLKECQEVYSKEYVTYKNFCAGFLSKASGACLNDIGGPGITAGILVGVISFGPPTCGTPDAPTVFTKIGYYADWIDDIVEMPAEIVVRQTTLLPPKTRASPYYTHMTKDIFHLHPISEGNGEFTETSVNYGYTSTASKKNLRILGDEMLFQEFLSTLFAKSNEDYSESSDDEATERETTKLIERKIRTTRTSTTSNTTPNQLIFGDAEIDVEITQGGSSTDRESIEVYAEVNEMNPKLIKDITKRTNESYEERVSEIKSIKTEVSVNQSIGENEDSELEEDIVELLKELDIPKILASEENLSDDTEKNETQRITEENVSNKMNIRKNPKEDIEPVSYSSEESSSTDDEGLGLIFE